MENKYIIILIGLLILITFLTQFYGSTDIADYSDTAKFFAGKYSAKIRSSHSYLFGFIHSPFLKITNSYISFKISSLVFLILIILSVYILSGKNKKALWLMTLSPVIWYMSPWISPIQLAALFFLWAYWFIEKFNKTNKLKYLICSGIFVGLAWCVWDTILYFGVFLAVVFLCNKNLSHSCFFIISLLIGLLPRLILDQYLFNFPFYTLIKSTMGGFANSLGGIYQSTGMGVGISYLNISLIILALPLYYWLLHSPKIFKKNKKSVVFLFLCIFLIFALPQIRYVMILAPIIILIISKELNDKQFKRQIIFSIIVILLFITPYLIQIKYSIIDKLNGVDISYLLEFLFKFV